MAVCKRCGACCVYPWGIKTKLGKLVTKEHTIASESISYRYVNNEKKDWLGGEYACVFLDKGYSCRLHGTNEKPDCCEKFNCMKARPGWVERFEPLRQKWAKEH